MAVFTGTIKGKDYSVTLPDNATPAQIAITIGRKAGAVPEGFKGTFDPRKAGFTRIRKSEPSQLGSFGSAYNQILLGNWQDEVKARVDTAAEFAKGLVRRGHVPKPAEVEQKYLSNLDREEQESQANWKKYPKTGWAGTATGVVGSVVATKGISTLPAAGAPLRWAAEAPNVIQKGIRAAPLAIPGGAVSGAGAGKPGNRTPGAVAGAVIAPGVAFAAPLVLAGPSKLASWAWQRFGPRNWAMNPTGWAEELSKRLKGIVTPDELKAAKAAHEKAGIPAAPLDVTGKPGQDVIAELGGRKGANAQPILEAEAVRRAKAVPQRIIQQARNIIGRNRAPGQTGPAQPLHLREKLGDLRDQQLDNAITPIRATRLSLPPTVTTALKLPDLKTAINGALKFTTNPAERAQLVRFGEQMAAQARYAKSALKGKPKGKAPVISPISLGATESLRRSLGKMEGANTPAITGMRQEISGFLEDSSPVYKKAFGDYRTQSAIAGPGKLGATSKIGKEQGEAVSLGQQVLTGDPEKMALQQANVGAMDTPVTFGTGKAAITITPRQAAAEGALSEVEKTAGSRTGAENVAGAMETEQQQIRNRIIQSGADAAELEGNIALETAGVAAAKRAMPQKFESDATEAAGNAALSGSGIFSTSGVIQARAVGGVVSILERAGISKGLAERIAKNAIDPAQTDTLIKTMIKEGLKEKDAKLFLHGVRSLVTRGAAGFNAAALRQQGEGETTERYGQETEFDYAPATSADDEFEYTAAGSLTSPGADLAPELSNVPVVPEGGEMTNALDEYEYDTPGE